MTLPVVICRSNPIAPDPRVEKIARALTAGGYSVSVIGWDRSGKLPKEQTVDGLRIFRLLIRARYGSGLMNLPALLVWQVGLMVWLARRRRTFQVIHACDFDTVIPALICKILWKKRVIYDIFDFYADHLRRTPAFLKNLIRRLDYWAIAKADGLILVDDSRFEQIRGSRPKAVTTIYNSPADVSLQPAAHPDPSGAPALRIAYIGLLQVERGLFEMIDVLRRHPEWHLDLAGFGGDEERILAAIREMPNVSWHGRTAYDRTLELSRGAGVLFATYDPTIPNHRYSSPNKVFEGMMLGKPIIVAENTNMDRMIIDNNCGIAVKYGDRDALERALSALAGDRRLREELGKNARRAYTEKYSWEIMQARLIDFYSQVLCKRQP